MIRSEIEVLQRLPIQHYNLLYQAFGDRFEEYFIPSYADQAIDRKIPWFRALTKLILHQQRESFLIVNPYFSGISFCHLFFDQNLMQVSFLVTILRQAENNCQKIVRKKANKLEQQ
ncbi:Hypothetical_protein [Hexamita inflata]|uniref:Hypothetical_protein n=1 Tax=Hexamita inflata TaxID=28002 RepID=A0AA86P7N2_9EUKA|nr:Hypothetical protein HINF_LOCUS19961 [Hexamita inflata]